MTTYHPIPPPTRGSKRFLHRYSSSSPEEDIVCVGEAQLIGESQQPQAYFGDVEAVVDVRQSNRRRSQEQYYFDAQTIAVTDTEIPFAVASVQPLLVENDHHHDDGDSSEEQQPLSIDALSPPTQQPQQQQQQLMEYNERHALAAAHAIVEDLPSHNNNVLRPEFLFVNAIKPTPDSHVGLTFKKKRGAIYLSHVDPDGLFARSGLQPGDRVVAVNHVNCIVAPLRAVRDVVEHSKSTVSLCVRNKHGDPHTVWSSVQKPTRNTKLGISFQMKRGALTVSRVKKGSLFEKSLLMPDHRCFWINGVPCEHMNSQEAANLTAQADRVTILSRARGDLATVLSVGEVVSRRWSAVAVGAGVAAAALGALGSMS